MFLKKSAQILAKNAILTRIKPETLIAQTYLHSQVSRNIYLQSKTSFNFAQITKDKIDEVMQIYTTLKFKPIESIYSSSLKLVQDSTDNIKSYLILNLITRAALEAKQFDKAIEFSLLQIEYLKKEEKNSLQIATCLYDLSILYFQKQKMTLAFQYAFEAEEMADELYQDKPQEFEFIYLQTQNNIANLFLHSQNYEKSLDYSNIVVKMDVQDNTQNLLQKFTGYNLQTQAFQSIANDQASHLAAEKAYILAKKKNLEGHRAYLFATLGYIFTELKKYERAKEVLNESIEIYKQVQGESSKNIQNLKQKIREIEELEKLENMNKQTVQHIGQVQNKQEQSSTQKSQLKQKEKQQNKDKDKDMDKATQYFKKGMYKEAQAEFELSLKQVSQIPESETKQYRGTLLNRIFTCQYLQNQFEDSLLTALESLECVIDDTDKSRIAKAYQNAGIAYEKTGDVPKAIEYFKKALDSFDEKSSSLDKYQVLVNLMRLHKMTLEFDESVKYGEEVLKIIKSANLDDIEIGRFKSGLSEAYYMNNQIEECFRMGEQALQIIEKTENGSKSHLYCSYQLLRAYEDNEYIEKVQQTALKCLELHEKNFGKETFDEIKYKTLQSLTNFYIMFGKYDRCMQYLDKLIDHTQNSSDPNDEYISYLILKAQIQQSLEQYFQALELSKNIFEIIKEANKGRIPFNEEMAKLYTLRYQLNYQNMNIKAFANNLIEYIEILNRESQERGYLTEHITQANLVLNQFIQNHKEDHPDICQQFQKYV